MPLSSVDMPSRPLLPHHHQQPQLPRRASDRNANGTGRGHDRDAAAVLVCACAATKNADLLSATCNPSTGRLHGPGPGRPGPGPGTATSSPVRGPADHADPMAEGVFGSVSGNDSVLYGQDASLLAANLSLADDDDVLQTDQDVQVGVAEQLLIAWRHIILDANTTDMGLGASMSALGALNVSSATTATVNSSRASGDGYGLGLELGIGLGMGFGLGPPDGYMQLGNSSWTDNEELVHLIKMVAVAVILGLVILATVIGNVFVIAAILLERHLQNVANYLILSLAVADLLVACLVMPLGAVYEVSQQWTLGPELCDMWTSSDVLCCTASILHLVAIALDRYWAVTNIDYIHQRTARRIGLMILVVWCVAFMVCIAPMLGWKDPGWTDRVTLDQECMVSQDIAYQIFATASSFYLPLLVILVLYWRIFQTARRRIRRRVQAQTAVGGRAVPGGPKNPAQGGVVAELVGVAGAAGGSGGLAAAVVGMIGRPLPTISEATTTTTTTAFTNVSSNNTSPEKTSFANGLENDPPTSDQMSCYAPPQHQHYPKRKKEAMDSKRERKAAKTLAIITGAFVMCWLPFFIMAILQPVCDTCYFNKYVVSLFLWLGYFNSTLNPIIYTIFSPEFRHAFKRLLCGRRATLRRRNRHMAARGRHL